MVSCHSTTSTYLRVPQLRCFPNPFADHLVCEAETEQVRLLDLSGREVLVGKPYSELNTAHLPAGMYILEVPENPGLRQMVVKVQP